jgi:hypothetical protein
MQQPCSTYELGHQPISSSGGSGSTAGSLMLPGRVLPASLVTAALPLLRSKPADIHRSVQGILLSLLPWAVNVSRLGQSLYGLYIITNMLMIPAS